MDARRNAIGKVGAPGVELPLEVVMGGRLIPGNQGCQQNIT